jgi:Gpi18-like mannosyltransferase
MYIEPMILQEALSPSRLRNHNLNRLTQKSWMMENTQQDQNENETPTAEISAKLAFVPIEIPLGTKTELTRPQYLQVYLLLVVFGNLFWLFWETHFDVGFWHDWVTQLLSKGYADYKGDYPPLWSHWLFIVSKFYSITGTPLENNLLFKYLTQIPITVFHLLLTALIYKILQSNNAKNIHFHIALLLTSLNPAILFVGPVWGQIDVAPTVPVIAALLAATSTRFQILAMPLFIVSLLTKFQMIAFAPVFGIIFLRNIKLHSAGVLISIFVFILAFLPAILAGNFKQAFSLPYIQSMNMFSASTMNATNLWFLLTGNYSPDNLQLFQTGSELQALSKLKYFGMLLFSAICLIIFILGFIRTYKIKDSNQLLQQWLFYCLACAVVFFAVLPAMHERYLIPAVLISLAYYASAPNRIIYPLVITFISAFNIALTHQIKTTVYWEAVSWLMMIAFAYVIFDLLSNFRWSNLVKKFCYFIFKIKGIAIGIYILSIPLVTYELFHEYKIYQTQPGKNQILLTSIKPVFVRQDYGQLNINKNINGGTLTAGGRRYANGFGTHANSRITFNTPTNAKTLSFIVDLDSGVVGADAQYSIEAEGKVIWQSAVFYRPEKNADVITVNIQNTRQLSLVASGVSSISGDHVNWINPVITLVDNPQ